MLTSSFFGARIGSSPAFVAARPVHRGVAHVQTPQSVVPLTIEAAHKKGSGSTKNGRDSVSKRRGVKVYGGQPVPAGGIIIRQLGTKVGMRFHSSLLFIKEKLKEKIHNYFGRRRLQCPFVQCAGPPWQECRPGQRLHLVCID